MPDHYLVMPDGSPVHTRLPGWPARGPSYRGSWPHPLPADPAEWPSDLLRIALDTDAARGPLYGPPTVGDLAAVLDAALRTAAERIRAGERVRLPHIGELEPAPSRHGSTRTLVYRADPALLADEEGRA
jgi:hypothetical protein